MAKLRTRGKTHRPAGTKLKRKVAQSTLGYSHKPGLVGAFYVEKLQRENKKRMEARHG